MSTLQPTSDYFDKESDAKDELLGQYSHAILRVLGSLKLTVVLFALSLILVLVGTLAQDEMNMLEVKQRYFLSWIAPLHLDDFLPQAFHRHEEPYTAIVPLPGGRQVDLLVWPFPGGALIGFMLMVNLIAAKITRFRIQGSGNSLIAGGAFIFLGLLATWFVVQAGHNSDGLQGAPPMTYDTLWIFCLIAMGMMSVGFFAWGTQAQNRRLRITLYQVSALLAVLLIAAIFTGFRIGDPGLRIVWQLTKGLGVAAFLMAGCHLVFGKQGGNVLLHFGVGLLMIGQFTLGDRQLEQRLSLIEGESTNTLVNLDLSELTFINRLDGEDEVVAIPSSRLEIASASSTVIADERLPVNVKVLKYFPNSRLKRVTDDKDPSQENLATKGLGLREIAISANKAGGTDGAINVPSAYVELFHKESGESLGVYMVSQAISDAELLMPGEPVNDEFDSVKVGETKYDIGLRLHREVKPYWVQLEDVRRVDYSGSDTPRDYSSFIRIVDTETGEDRRDRVWMNNPLRYRGETFYQSNYTPLAGGKEMTGIQVVRNSGWLIPYVACSITALGMLVHFLGTLTRFLDRRERETRKEVADEPASQTPVWIATGAFAVLALYMLIPWSAVMNTVRPQNRMRTFDYYAAGKIPTQYGGRVMPLDAYARQTLKSISNSEKLSGDTLPAAMKDRLDKNVKSLSAMQWLMEVAVDEQALEELPMFRVDSDEVRTELGLERRKSKLYSIAEIAGQLDAVDKIVEVAVKKESIDQSFKEKKLIELKRRINEFSLAAAAFRLPMPKNFPDSFFPEGTDEQTKQMFAIRELQMRMEGLEKSPAPAIIPPTKEASEAAVDNPDWAVYGPAFLEVVKSSFAGEEKSRPGIDSFGEMISAYRKNDSVKFNEAVDSHLAAVSSYRIAGYTRWLPLFGEGTWAVSLERWMQSNWPNRVAVVLYLSALVMGLVFFMARMPRLRRATWGIIAIGLVVHTLTIVARVYITGRAPVINLYSSALFIGWAAVLFGLVIERIFKYGTGNLLGATSGTLALLVAYGLSSGDTMPVLQAVLDTQFWLATHVISVTLGYVATMVAGFLGIGYLIAGWVGKPSKTLRDLYRMCYGAACFGILFSFVGTVLGGLWADDSWGRFWGWDPKENGALLIVIWNALMLHARWDGMVKARGFSILAIGGNIVTAWSWFGTNELGIGLHSYGFTSGVLMWLSLFVGTQIAFIALGLFFGKKPPSDAMAM